MNEQFENEQGHSSYSRKIGITGWVFATIAAVISIAALFSIMAEPAEDTGEKLDIAERIAERKVLSE